jgi:ABC-type multidrug transport system fused ATPase/permease subunit
MKINYIFIGNLIFLFSLQGNIWFSLQGNIGVALQGKIPLSSKRNVLKIQEEILKRKFLNPSIINKKSKQINDTNPFNFSFNPLKAPIEGKKFFIFIIKKYWFSMLCILMGSLWEIIFILQWSNLESYLKLSYQALNTNHGGSPTNPEFNSYHVKIFKFFTDNNHFQDIKFKIIIGLSVLFIFFIISYVINIFLESLAEKFFHNINIKIINTFVASCLNQQPHKYSKDLFESIKNNAKVFAKIMEKIIFLMGKFFIVTYVFIQLFQLSRLLFCLNFIFMGINGFVFFLLYPKFNLLNKITNEKQRKDSNLLKTTIENISLINLYNKNKIFIKHVKNKQQAHDVIFNEGQKTIRNIKMFLGGIQLSYELLAYGILIYKFKKKNGSILLLWQLNKMNKDTVYVFVGKIPGLFKNILDFDKSFKLLLLEMIPNISHKNLIFTGNFKIVNGNKTYGNQKILNNINFVMDDNFRKKYQKNSNTNGNFSQNNLNIALIGESGSGKSTFIKSLNGLIPLDKNNPTKENILEESIFFEVILDKKYLSHIKYEMIKELKNNQVKIWIQKNQINTDEFKNSFLNISQEAQIINDSILVNFTFGADEDPSIIEFILKKVNLWDNIIKKPKKLKTYLASGNQSNFSGGQLQRINIGRGLYTYLKRKLSNGKLNLSRNISQEESYNIYENILTRGPNNFNSSDNFLFLDEITSALDHDNKKIINEIFLKIPGTKFFVTHDIKTLNEFDCILIFKNGEIVAIGTYDELMNNPDFSWMILTKSHHKY